MTGLRGAAAVLAAAVMLAGCGQTYLGRFVWLRDVDVEDYRHLPARPVAHAPAAPPFVERRDSGWMARALGTFDGQDLSDATTFDAFAARTGTTAFLILADGVLVEERYYNGYQRDSLFKSFSISKSVLSALFGIAAAEGMIAREDRLGQHIAAITNPALANVQLGALLDNVSGFAYARGFAPWKQQPRMYYTTDVRRYLRLTSFAHTPGTRFEAEDLSPLLVGYALEQALRKRDPKATLSDFASKRLWQPMGAQFDALWTLDHDGDGLEKTESGFTARFAAV
jgi:CubicO group peptidase (beta-lactamase class C family)